MLWADEHLCICDINSEHVVYEQQACVHVGDKQRDWGILSSRSARCLDNELVLRRFLHGLMRGDLLNEWSVRLVFDRALRRARLRR